MGNYSELRKRERDWSTLIDLLPLIVHTGTCFSCILLADAWSKHRIHMHEKLGINNK